jgi:hypothetical protein
VTDELRRRPAQSVTLLCALALTLSACPGTLDDLDSFEGAAPGAVDARIDGGTSTARDGDSRGPDAGSLGGGSGANASSGTGNLDGGKPASSGGGAVSCDFKALMQSKCGSSGCHGAPALSTGLDLTSEGLAARLKDEQASGACSDYLLIDTAAPERSALYLMTTDDSCGIRMPLGGTLSTAEQTCILQWIENL